VDLAAEAVAVGLVAAEVEEDSVALEAEDSAEAVLAEVGKSNRVLLSTSKICKT
jgi:hypothetical protein